MNYIQNYPTILVLRSKQELKRVLSHTSQISESYLGLKRFTAVYDNLWCIGINIGKHRKIFISKIDIKSHEGGVTKQFKTPGTRNNGRLEKTKNSRPTYHSSLLHTLLSLLASCRSQLHLLCQGMVVHSPDIGTESVACE